MSTLISGNDVAIYIRTSTSPDVYKVITCANDASWTNSMEIIESKTKCGTSRKTGTKSWELSFNGKVNITPGAGEVSFAEIWASFDAGIKEHLHFKDAALNFAYEGDGYISKLDINAQVDDDVDFTFTVSGDGEFTAVPVAFSPGDLSPWAWYDAGEGVTGTSSVTAWADQSGNGRNLTGGTAKPALVTGAINSLPAIYSDGTADTSMATGVNLPDLTAGATIYLVAKQISGESSNGPFASSGTNLIIRRNGSNDHIAGGSESTSPHALQLATNNTYYTIRLRVASGNVYLSLNNGTESSVSRSPSYLGNPLVLFNNSGTIGTKYIAEMIVYTASHTTDERNDVEGYLKDKYAHY